MTRPICTSLALLAGCAPAAGPTSRPPNAWRDAHAAAVLEQVQPRPDDPLVWREEQFDVPRPVDAYYADFLVGAARLENFLPGTRKLPGVDHNEDLTPTSFPAVGSRRLVCLTSGDWAVEEVLSRHDRGFRYLVSNYSLRQARPVHYAIGEFRFEPLGPAATRVTWRYSFKLRDDRFPGTLGALGRRMFRGRFLERDYADFMRAGAAAMQAWALRPA